MQKILFAVLLACAAVSVQAQNVLCESINGAYRECRVGSAGKIRLVNELSTQACYEGVTWGTRSDGVVWVERNCRALFAADVGGKRLVCESLKGTQQLCPADVSNGVALAVQLSKADCVRGDTWDFDVNNNLVWVDKGCRGEFLLGGTAPPPRKVTLDGAVVCESENNKRKECAADTTAGVQLVRVLSENACAFGRDWGWNAKGIWVSRGCRAEFAVKGKPKPMARALTCESQNNTRSHCEAETRFGVAIVRQLSENPCVLEETWGFNEKGVWVDKGCRAQFALGGYRLPEGAVPATAARVTCESTDGARKVCAVDTARGVGLIRQMSDSDCVLNRTWGYGAEGIWVTGGCGAEFAVAR